MDFALTLWLRRLLPATSDNVPLSQLTQRKPMEIEVERLPDYLWRDLGFPQPRRSGGE
jgi:hypothetical protein